MSKIVKSFAIISYEWLQSTIDGKMLLIKYSIADDENGTKNLMQHSVVVKISRNVIADVTKTIQPKIVDEYLAKYIIEFIREEIRKTLRNGNELSDEIAITSYNKLLEISLKNESRLSEWEIVEMTSPFGFNIKK